MNSPSSTIFTKWLPLTALAILGMWFVQLLFQSSGEDGSRPQSVSVQPFPKHAAPPRDSIAQIRPSIDDSEIEDEVFADDPLSYVPDEILLKVGSKAEVVQLLELAMANGGEFVDAVAALKTFRLRFDSNEDAEAFRDQLGDDYESENNYLVKAPDFPEYETRDDSEPQTLTGFGTGALEWLGIAGDHSEWGAGVLVAILDTSPCCI